MRRCLLDPFLLIGGMMVLQVTAWFFLMPNESHLPGTLPRFWCVTSVFRFLAISAALLVGIVAGKSPTLLHVRRLQGSTRMPTACRWEVIYAAARVLSILSIALLLVLLAGIIVAPSRTGMIGQPQGTQILANELKEEAPALIPTLSLVWYLPAALLLQIVASPEVPRTRRRIAAWYLSVLFFALLLYSFFFAARTNVLYLVLMWLATSLMASARAVSRRMVSVGVLILLVVWGGALTRTGLTLAIRENLSVFDLEVHRAIWDELVAGYLAADFNSTMVIMSLKSDIATNWAFGSALAPFTSAATPYRLGTVNIVGIWWYEFGWLACLVAAGTGVYLGRLYLWVERRTDLLNWRVTLFLISYPGMYAMMRVNYWFSPAFIVPFMFAVVTYTVIGRSARSRIVVRIPGT